jgi:hypothetical protein
MDPAVDAKHDRGHTDAPNMKHFLRWADILIGHSRPG